MKLFERSSKASDHYQHFDGKASSSNSLDAELLSSHWVWNLEKFYKNNCRSLNVWSSLQKISFIGINNCAIQEWNTQNSYCCIAFLKRESDEQVSPYCSHFHWCFFWTKSHHHQKQKGIVSAEGNIFNLWEIVMEVSLSVDYDDETIELVCWGKDYYSEISS